MSIESNAILNDRFLAGLISRIQFAGDDDCWLWSGALNDKGYGQFKLGRKPLRAHRVTLTMADGDCPEDKPWALHGCDTPACVNPRHLRWGTHADNVLDAVKRGRAAGLDGKRKGEGNPASKLTVSQVMAIRADPRRQSDIADQYGIGCSTVSGIKARRFWAHLPDERKQSNG